MKKNILRFAYAGLLILAFLSSSSRPHTKSYATTVVKKFSATGQNSGGSLTTLYTPSSDESLDYRVSAYISGPQQAAAGTASVTIYWTDENGAGNFSCSTGSLGITSSSYNAVQSSGACVIHLGSGQSITYQLQATGTPNFDVFLTV